MDKNVPGQEGRLNFPKCLRLAWNSYCGMLRLQYTSLITNQRVFFWTCALT